MNECFASTQNTRKHLGGFWNMCLGHVIGIRKIPSLHLAHRLESLSCIMGQVTAGVRLWPPYTPASFIAYTHIPGLWYGIHVYIQKWESL